MNGVKLLPKFKAAFILALGVIGGASLGAAEAAPITKTYNYTFTNFGAGNGVPPAAPYPIVTFNATLTFDPTVPYPGVLGSTTPVVTTNLPSNIYNNWQWTFSPQSPGSTDGLLYIGNQCVAGNGFGSAANCGLGVVPPPNYPSAYMLIYINTLTGAVETNPTSVSFVYDDAAAVSTPGLVSYSWFSTTATVSTPEPMTFSLLITGIIGIGMTRVRRRRTADHTAVQSRPKPNGRSAAISASTCSLSSSTASNFDA